MPAINISPRHMSQGMDRVQIQALEGHKVLLARIKDNGGVWLGMREVYNKLGGFTSWQRFHKIVKEGETLLRKRHVSGQVQVHG